MIYYTEEDITWLLSHEMFVGVGGGGGVIVWKDGDAHQNIVLISFFNSHQ